MQFMPMRALSSDTKSVLTCLARDGEVVVTNNGQPLMLLVDLAGRDLIDTVSNLRNSRPSMPTPLQQREALERFMAAVDARDDEPLNEDDYSALENNRVEFNREIDL